jgi:hypothetical protein
MDLGIVPKILLVILPGEFLIHFVFNLISRSIGKTNRDKITRASILKGLIERAFVLTTLWFNLSSSLTLLGALKIATRIKDTEDKVSNDFFLLGNLISVSFGVLYFVILKNLIG